MSCVATLMLQALVLGCAQLDVIEEWIEPLERSEFFANIYEQRWYNFPHNKSLLPITLDHVSEWIVAQGSSSDVIETLQHPLTGQSFRPSSAKLTPLEQIQEAFLQGFSMVINSLHGWSEPGKRLAQRLYEASDLPVDVYMYLTPPHSKSYGMHSDVMDAFMVQLGGAKLWRACDVPEWMRPGESTPQIMKTYNGNCEEITLKGGDVMYLPFGTLHQATTEDELSMHLTVNVERQYYVWLSLLLGVIHKALRPELTVQAFAGSGDFQTDEDPAPLAQLLLGLAPSLPALQRMPGFSLALEGGSTARWLTRPLCNEDLPAGYLEKLLVEFRELAASLAQLLQGSKGASRQLRIGSKAATKSQIASLLVNAETEQKALPWALELARYHAVSHFIKSSSKNWIFPMPDVFTSLAATRAAAGAEGVKDLSSSSVAKLLSSLPPGARLRRHPQLRAVLLQEGSPQLLLNGNEVTLRQEEVPVVRFCLGRFAEISSQGRPFFLSEVPGLDGKEAKKIVRKLLSNGALQVVAPDVPL